MYMESEINKNVTSFEIFADDEGKEFIIEEREDLTGNRPFSCSFGCGKRFLTAGNLSSHVINRHSKEKTFYCTKPNCGKKYYQLNGLKIHQKNKHPKDKSSKNSLENCPTISEEKEIPPIKSKNKRDEKYYICPFPKCKLPYTTKDGLRTHVTKHHKCNFCNKRYEIKNDKKATSTSKEVKSVKLNNDICCCENNSNIINKVTSKKIIDKDKFKKLDYKFLGMLLANFNFLSKTVNKDNNNSNENTNNNSETLN